MGPELNTSLLRFIVSSTKLVVLWWSLLLLAIRINVLISIFQFCWTLMTLLKAMPKKEKPFWIFTQMFTGHQPVAILCSHHRAPMIGFSITSGLSFSRTRNMLLFEAMSLSKMIHVSLTTTVHHRDYQTSRIQFPLFAEKTLANGSSPSSFPLGWIIFTLISIHFNLEKKRLSTLNIEDALFDFNVGYIGTAIQLCFFVYYIDLISHRAAVEAVCAKYISTRHVRLCSYEWSVDYLLLLYLWTAIIIDDYSRVNQESPTANQSKEDTVNLNIWMTITAIIGIIIKFFAGQVSNSYPFCDSSFSWQPFFALLNYAW